MALARLQAALAKLATEAEARAAFAHDPIAAARSLGLDEPDAAMLARMAPEALRRFAGSLRAKRELDTRKWLPLTALALGDDFAPRLGEVLAEPPPGTMGDVAALVDALTRDPGDVAPWIVALARYEDGFVKASRPGFVFRIRWFRYPVVAIAAAARRGEAIAPSRGACVAIWSRLSRGRRLWHRVWRLRGAFQAPARNADR